MAKKAHWSYTEITEEAERQIRRATHDAGTATSPAIRTMHNDHAMGAYLFWLGLTEESPNVDDLHRLKELVKGRSGD
jgi:hypothetical protein